MLDTNIVYSDDSYMGVSMLEDTAESNFVIQDEKLPFYFNELEHQRIGTEMTSDQIYLCANGLCDIVFPKLCNNKICSSVNIAASMYYDLSGYMTYN